MTTTWKERHASLLAWLNIYDIPIKLIMFFITAVAVFNIGASLWMIIIEKTREIGILQSMGLNKSNITYIMNQCIILYNCPMISILWIIYLCKFPLFTLIYIRLLHLLSLLFFHIFPH